MDEAKVLLVEDEPLILMEVEDALREAGFHVIAAPSGKAAMQHFDAVALGIRALITNVEFDSEPNGWDVGSPCPCTRA